MLTNFSLGRVIDHFTLIYAFLAFAFSQSFTSPQREYYTYLNWAELKREDFFYPKVGPLIDGIDSSISLLTFYAFEQDKDRIFNADLFPEFTVNNSDSPNIRLFGSVQMNLLANLSIQNEFEFDNKGSDDSNFMGTQRISAGNWVGYLQHSTLTWYYRGGFFSIGRGNPFFISPNESVFLNAAIPPLEHINWSHKKNDFHFNWSIMLSKSNQKKRFISFHRYGFHKPKLNLGFTEAVIGTYDNWSSDEIGYILPASVLLETEENRGINANLVWVLDGKVKWKKWMAYFEILIDDFALDGGSPPQIGGIVGVSRKVKKFLTNLEYTRINRWTGNHCNPLNSWIENQIPIGHSIGSDAHQLLLSIFYSINKKNNIETKLIWGENGIGSPIDRLMEWPMDVACDQNFGYNKEIFPSSSNRSLSGQIKFSCMLKKNLLFKLGLVIDKKKSSDILMTLNYKL